MSQNTNVEQTAEVLKSVGQIGCAIGLVAVIIVGIAFGIGWWIDGLLGNERKIATILLMLGSFPISLYAMIKISLTMVARANARVASGTVAGAQPEEKKDV